MLRSFTKFKNSVYAKVFLVIIAIPFVFWGMGPVFQGGKLNTVVVIGKNKVPTNEFINYIKTKTNNTSTINKEIIEQLLSSFIGEKLISYEIDEFNFNVSDSSLIKIIKNEKIFQKQNEFSRTKYEKFLVENSIDAVTVENNISNQEKITQFYEFVGGGIIPPEFLVNINYNNMFQKKHVQFINLSTYLKNKNNYSDNEIISYYEKNKNNYKIPYKNFKYTIVTPKSLIGDSEYSSLFFEKIDEIDDLLVEGNDLDFIISKYNLEKYKTITFDSKGFDKKMNKINLLEPKLIDKLFYLNTNNKTLLEESKNEYFIYEFINDEIVQQKVEDKIVRDNIISRLDSFKNNMLISEVATKIKTNNFNKLDFDKFAKSKNIEIKKIIINGIEDNKILNDTIVNQIYKYPKEKVVLTGTNDLENIYLVYISKVENVSIELDGKNLNDYKKNSKLELVSSLYNNYDLLLKKKYKIEINYKALNSVESYF